MTRKMKCQRSFHDAQMVAKRFAKEGPRVAAVLALYGGKKLQYSAVPGFIDEDTDTMKQIALFTPDGRKWTTAYKDNPMADLELRRAALEASGWHTEFRNGEPESGYTGMIAVESDPAAFWPWFLELCRKNDWQWTLQTCEPHDKFKGRHFVFWLHDSNDLDAEADGDTPEISGCRAVIAASKRGSK